MFSHASRIGIWGLMAAGVVAAPSLAAAQCREYAVRRVYTTPVVYTTYAAPAYPVVTYPVYAEPVYVAPPVVRTYARCYTPAVSVHVGRGYGYRDHSWYRGSHHHRGWSARVRVDGGHHGRSFDLNVRRHRR